MVLSDDASMTVVVKRRVGGRSTLPLEVMIRLRMLDDVRENIAE